MEKLPFSVCIITKNNAKTLERCLQSASNYFDEIVIADTGSSDSTKEIARHYTNQIFDFTWNNNFADARNFAIKKATNDFIFSLDSDEEISKINCRQLLDFSKKNAENIGRIEILNLQSNHTFEKGCVSRIFNRKFFHFEGSVHEQLVSSSQINRSLVDLDVSIIHYGYANEDLNQKKAQLYREMIEKKLKETPDDSYLLYQLGRTYDIQKDFVDASEAYLKSLQTSPRHDFEYFRSALDDLCFDYLNLNEAKKAAEIINFYGYPYEDADGYFMFGHVYMNLGNFDEAVRCFKKATEFADSSRPGANSFAAWFNIGVIYEVLGFKEKSIKAYKKCNDYDPAKERLKNLM